MKAIEEVQQIFGKNKLDLGEVCLKTGFGTLQQIIKLEIILVLME